MGVTIKCKKTGSSIDMGYGGFKRLRAKVAELCGEEWYNHYKKIDNSPLMYGREEFFKNFDAETERLISVGAVHIKIVNFCVQSDCGGHIRYGACKMIYNYIKDYDDDIAYGYVGRADCAKFADFKQLLLECQESKSDLVWS